MSRPPMRMVKRDRQVTAEERYNSLYARYCNSEFTYDCHRLIEKLVEKGMQEPHMEGVQLYKILMEICKILMMNELEVLFLGATVQEMQWRIVENCLNNYIKDFQVLCPKLKADNYSKKMQLSLLLIAYIVKLYLNEDMSMFESKMHQIVQRGYEKMYQEWVQKMKKNFKFSPKNMNKLFNELDVVRVKKEKELQEVNYNSKVEDLFKEFMEHEPHKNRRHREETPMEHESDEQEPVVPQNVLRSDSIRSINSFSKRQSFQDLLRRENSIPNTRQPSLFVRSSVDDMM